MEELNDLDVAVASLEELHEALIRYITTEWTISDPHITRLAGRIRRLRPAYLGLLWDRAYEFQRNSALWLLCELFQLPVVEKETGTEPYAPRTLYCVSCKRPTE